VVFRHRDGDTGCLVMARQYARTRKPQCKAIQRFATKGDGVGIARAHGGDQLVHGAHCLHRGVLERARCAAGGGGAIYAQHARARLVDVGNGHGCRARRDQVGALHQRIGRAEVDHFGALAVHRHKGHIPFAQWSCSRDFARIVIDHECQRHAQFLRKVYAKIDRDAPGLAGDRIFGGPESGTRVADANAYAEFAGGDEFGERG
jgi:hypothetical protein